MLKFEVYPDSPKETLRLYADILNVLAGNFAIYALAAPAPTLESAAAFAPIAALTTAPEAAAAFAPVAAPLQAPAPVALAASDARGLPWDERIHSSTRATNKDGSWKQRRGVQPAQVSQIETELRALAGIPATAPAPQAGFQTEVAAITPLAPSAPLPAPIAPATPGAPVTTFVELMHKVSPLMQGSKLTLPEILGVLNRHGVESLQLLSARLDLIPTVDAEISALVMGR